MKLLFSLSSAVALSLLALGATSNVVSAAESAYDRILRTGTIRAAYATYPPLLIKDSNTGKFSGLGFEVLELTAKKLGLKLQMTEEVSWGTMIEGLRTNRYDILACPVWANATRSRAAYFTRPLFYSVIHAYARTSDKRFDSDIKVLNDPKYKIATMDGEMAEMITQSDFPKAKRFSLPQMSDVPDMLMSIAMKKADVTFAEPNAVFYFEKHNPNALRDITPKRPLRIFPNVFMFNIGEDKLKSMLNTTLDEISNDGELDSIINKYEPFKGDYLRVAAPYQR
ncbi:MAG TPA: transporter substrate-binding domain-containing protein [Oculatellaceae cyanobacterium]